MIDHVFLALRTTDASLADDAVVTQIAVTQLDSELSKSRWGHFNERVVDFEKDIRKIEDALAESPRFVVVAYRAESLRRVIDCNLVRGRKPFAQDRAWIDLAQLAWPLAYAGLLEDRSLFTLAKHFGVKQDDQGRPLRASIWEADQTAWVVTMIYREMMRRYKTALVTENVVSEVGGATFDGLRRLFGY